MYEIAGSTILLLANGYQVTAVPMEKVAEKPMDGFALASEPHGFVEGNKPPNL
jgi:hypothetical protein